MGTENMFNTLIFNMIFAFLTSAVLVFVSAKPFINMLKNKQNLAQPIRSDGPTTHYAKKGTPSLGGVLIMFAFFASTLIWTKINITVLVIIFTSLSFALIGLWDDLLKLLKQNSKGLRGKLRMLIGFIIALIATYILSTQSSNFHLLYLPFNVPFVDIISRNYISLGIVASIVLGALVILASANSTNLTDGLDGLASYVSIIIFTTLLILLFFMILNKSIFIYNDMKETPIVISAMLGSLVAFLYYNKHPAKIFMGDVGSLGIGSTIGIIVVSYKHELFLLLAGLILVIESISVIIQVYYYKLTKKRFFLMAPIHHHFEKKGFSETKVVQMFVLFTIVSCTLALLLL